jgi:hypothetical protein
MIERTEGADQGFGLAAMGLGALAREAGPHGGVQRMIDARSERQGTAQTAR